MDASTAPPTSLIIELAHSAARNLTRFRDPNEPNRYRAGLTVLDDIRAIKKLLDQADEALLAELEISVRELVARREDELTEVFDQRAS